MPLQNYKFCGLSKYHYPFTQQMILSHFSHTPFKFNQSATYQSDPFNFKPNGLWLSDENDFGWKQWCEGEEFEIRKLEFETKFEIDTSNVLVLNSDQMIIDFNEKYSKPRDFGGELLSVARTKMFNKMFSEWFDIDWKRVMNEYDGIIISPYSWNCRSKFFWYNPWDCACGCIWKLSCVKQV